MNRTNGNNFTDRKSYTVPGMSKNFLEGITESLFAKLVNEPHIAEVNKRKQLLLVLPAPPLPLNQGYRHAAYNDVVQLSRLCDLHILICNGAELVYDFRPDSYALNRSKLNSIPGVKSVSFIEFDADWKKPLHKIFLHQIKVLLRSGNLMQESSADKLTQKIIELCKKNNISDIHLGITINLFLDVFINLQRTGKYRISFTAHDIDADKVWIRMKENLARKKFIKVITNFFVYQIILWKEIHTCRKSRFVIAMAFRDYERLERKKVNVFFIPPYLHSLPADHTLSKPSSTPSLVVLGHLAFSAAGRGIELFVEKVAAAVKEKVPGITIKIIGKDASKRVIDKCNELGIFYCEYVENAEELWNETTVVASPLLVSKGIRIRILEAAIRGIPVVCTEQSATGFYNPEEFLRVTNNFMSFAENCIELLTDEKKYRLEQERIKKYFERNLSEEKIKLRWQHVWSVNFPESSSLPQYKKIIEQPIR